VTLYSGGVQDLFWRYSRSFTASHCIHRLDSGGLVYSSLARMIAGGGVVECTYYSFDIRK
jgi:hypothetical protein